MQMEHLNFTRNVLGTKAAARLEARQVIQTIRAGSSSIVQDIADGRVKPGDIIQVSLNEEFVGYARFTGLEKISWKQLSQEDARRGGFDNRFELAYALKRAGYRFVPLDKYQVYRYRFSWLEEDEP